MRITCHSFFEHYIIHPLSSELSIGEKILSLALSILVGTVTFGIAHICAYAFHLRNISPIKNTFAPRHKVFEKIADQISSIQIRAFGGIEIEQDSVLSVIQKDMIEQFYARPLPSKEDVTVTLAGEKRKWVTLSRAQKITVNNTGTRAHNQLSRHCPELFVDATFFAEGQKPFLEGDPRKSHGSDHASRVAIFAGIFAYLYHKYHPSYTVSRNELSLCQILGAGHDSGRQTEGPDVYDADSAENTIQVLKSRGIVDERLLKTCYEAVANKDSEPDEKKSLLAKCLQNADSADFARLNLFSEAQSFAEFEHARNFLDIFKEFKAMAKKIAPQNPSKAVLKDGLTYEDFCYELDAIRKEMNDLIYSTHQKEQRLVFLRDPSHYFEQILHVMRSSRFPLLHAISLQIGIIASSPLENPVYKQAIAVQETIYAWKKFGFLKIGSGDLSNMAKALEEVPFTFLSERGRGLLEEIGSLLDARTREREAFEALLKQDDLTENVLLHSYAHLSFSLKPLYLKAFEERWHTLTSPVSYTKRLKELIQAEYNPDSKLSLQTVLADLKRHKLNKLIEATKEAHESTLVRASLLVEKAKKLSELYKKIQKNSQFLPFLDPSIVTTLALALEQAAWIYQENGDTAAATQALKQAGIWAFLPSNSPFANLFHEEISTSPQFLEGDCGFIRRRKIRMAQKNKEGALVTVLSFELPYWVRKRLDQRINLLSPEQHQLVPAEYPACQEGLFSPSFGMLTGIGSDRKIQVAKGVTVYIGAEEAYWNNYTLLRVECQKDVPSQRVHEVLSRLGLPMALLPSRREDRRNQALSAALSFHFPQKAHTESHERKDPEALFRSLSEEEQAIVRATADEMRVTQVDEGHFELSLPSLPDKVRELGGRSLGTFVGIGGSFKEQAGIVLRILKSGFLSSKERYERGILGYGCAPLRNYLAGSGNQVFTRMFSRTIYEKGFDIDDFPVNGRLLFILDLQALERLPYGYLRDVAGVRNPHYRATQYYAQKQEVITDLRGSKAMQEERRNPLEFMKHLLEDPFPLHEIMFDQSLSARYIRHIVVRTDLEKVELMLFLGEKGIEYINGIALKDVIIVSNKLDGKLLKTTEKTSHERKDNVTSCRDGLF